MYSVNMLYHLTPGNINISSILLTNNFPGESIILTISLYISILDLVCKTIIEQGKLVFF